MKESYKLYNKEVKKMSYRGPGLNYKIKKVTKGNKTGDSYAITVPSIVAQKFESCLFKLTVSGNAIIYESGCKIKAINTNQENKKFYVGGGTVSFK